MPIYEYLCPNGHRQELIQPLALEIKLPIPCPECKENADRVPYPGNTSFRLKGDGWAKDGYGK